MGEVILEMIGISKHFGATRALDRVSLAARSREVLALMGENGAGKSTLMKILSGIYPPDAGEIRLAGQRVRLDTPAAARRAGINLIYQELSVVPNLSVAENIFLGAEPRTRFGGVDHARMRHATQRLLDQLDARFDPHTPAHKLSVANQQQVEIARALAQQSRVLIMDEPTAALSKHESERLFAMIAALRNQDIAIIYISHRMEEVSQLADRIIVLRDGGQVGHFARGDCSPRQLVRLMVGRPLDDIYPPPSDTAQGPVKLEVLNLGGGKVASASFQVRAGEILGLAGLVGAGRSELARLIFGADAKQRGTLRLDGAPIDIRSPRDAMRHGIGYVPEDRKSQGLFLQLTMQANTTMNVLREHARGGVLDLPALRTLTRQAIARLAIKAPDEAGRVAGLSGGNQQKVLLARWLAIRPRVLILDEPTRGVDIGAKAEIYRLIHQLAHQGVAIVCISSELAEIVGISHRVAVMRAGRIAGELRGKQISPESIMMLASPRFSAHASS
ncbi:sugar ABC transporter ATP-binding protein [Paludibacterium sp.]|uniref:sugar ABC transporter ATP-binding protein n=1 Tax=Paludibacterium sp. TaxID=1917523 RepID=UPI0025FAC7DF|nr:sugar ABC transporter ATP-binding protein [Paludibacterium sp.]MBV8645853.1 sugar ABC transporter ATP-binding protein [Paludibacterium sp.]